MYDYIATFSTLGVIVDDIFPQNFTSLQNAWGYTPLMGASMTDQADIAKLLLEHKANSDYQNKKVI